MEIIIFLGLYIGIIILFTRLVLKIPFVKKLNWKIIAGLLLLLKIFDIHSTYSCCVKAGSYEAETNFTLRWFIENSGLGLFWSLVVHCLIIVPLIILLIKFLINEKLYFVPVAAVIGLLLAVINNYIGYFFLI